MCDVADGPKHVHLGFTRIATVTRAMDQKSRNHGPDHQYDDEKASVFFDFEVRRFAFCRKHSFSAAAI